MVQFFKYKNYRCYLSYQLNRFGLGIEFSKYSKTGPGFFCIMIGHFALSVNF